MAIAVNHNYVNLNIQNVLGRNHDNLGKSIERLSSGLRINHASDDPSGLSVANRMKSQLTGMQTARRNTQDGLSMLQTAEGGIETITSMLQRMRELAVQAANGVFTSTDAMQLQKEVDQLKAEINRVTEHVNFNTKRLLDGDSLASWTSNSKGISARINGEAVEGNYEVQVHSIPGQNSIYNTGILVLGDDQYAGKVVRANPTTLPPGVPVPQGANISMYSSDAKFTTGSSYYTLSVKGTVSQTVSFNSLYKQSPSSFSLPATGMKATSIVKTGYLNFKVEDVGSAVITNGTVVTTVKSTIKQVSYSFYDPYTGNSITKMTDAQITKTTSGITIKLDNADYGKLEFQVKGTLFQKGDQFMVNIQKAVTVDPLTSGGGTLALTGGPKAHELNQPLYVSFEQPGSLTSKDDKDDYEDVRRISLYTFKLDEHGGKTSSVRHDLSFAETEAKGNSVYGHTHSGLATLAIKGKGDPVTESTKLSQIANFYDANGKSMVANGQTITVFGNGRNEEVKLEADDTVRDLSDKMSAAIIKLGMGANLPNSGTLDKMHQINRNLVQFIDNDWKMNNTNEGSFAFQSSLLGDLSDLEIVGGTEEFNNALQIENTQKSANSLLYVDVRDYSTKRLLGSDVVSNNILKSGIINGADLSIKSTSGTQYSWNSASNTLNIEPTSDSEKYVLHLVDQRTNIQIGADEGENFNVSVMQLDTEALGVDGVSLMTKSKASKAMTDLDYAIGIAVSARAKIGAQISRMNYTTSNIEDSIVNLTSSKSRIMDADVAEETSDYTKNKVLNDSSQSMLAQQNSNQNSVLRLLQGLGS